MLAENETNNNIFAHILRNEYYNFKKGQVLIIDKLLKPKLGQFVLVNNNDRVEIKRFSNDEGNNILGTIITMN